MSYQPVPLTVHRLLTSAELLALNTTKIEIIPAPGSGRYVVCQEAVLKCNFVTTAYVGSATIFLQPSSLGISNSSSQLISQTSALTYTTNRTLVMRPAATVITGGTTQIVDNDGVSAALNSAVTTGNGTVDLYVSYYILNL